MTYNYDHDGIRERVLASLRQDDDTPKDVEAIAETEKRQVSRAEFMMLVQNSLHSLQIMGISHNFTVGQVDALISRATRLEEIDGIRVYYYFNQETMDVIVEAEVKEYGLIPIPLTEGEEVSVHRDAHSEIGDDRADEIKGEFVEYDLEDGYVEIDKTDFFIVTEQIRNRLGMLAMQINDQITGLKTMVEEIEDYETEGGITVTFFYTEETDQFSYVVQKKRPLGFGLSPSKRDE